MEKSGIVSRGVLAGGFAHLHCDTSASRHLVAFCRRGHGFCPSCLGRRMTRAAPTWCTRVLPEVRIRQWVLTMPYPRRFPLAFDGAVLGSRAAHLRADHQEILTAMGLPAEPPLVDPGRPPPSRSAQGDAPPW